jgi:hypothetical protein
MLAGVDMVMMTANSVSQLNPGRLKASNQNEIHATG